MADHLRRAGLAGEVDAFQTHGGGSAAWIMVAAMASVMVSQLAVVMGMVFVAGAGIVLGDAVVYLLRDFLGEDDVGADEPPPEAMPESARAS